MDPAVPSSNYMSRSSTPPGNTPSAPLGSHLLDTDSVLRRNSEQDVNPQNDKRKLSAPYNAVTPLQGESQVPRRLSLLFTPPNQDLLINEVEEQSNESTRLLSNESKGAILPSVIPKNQIPAEIKSVEEELDRLSILDKIEDGISESDFDSNGGSSDVGSDSTEEDEPGFTDREVEASAWDDTICSNRSAYFKHYYQKNLNSLGNPRPSPRASSHNSLASLIKEKDNMASSTTPDSKKKKKEDISLMILVIFLFLVLVVGISLIYHFYKIHLEELSLFKRLKYHDEGRLLDILDIKGKIDLQARLGTTLSPYLHPEDCTEYMQYMYRNHINIDYENSNIKLLQANKSATDFVVKRKARPDEFQFDDETVCLDWSNQARVQIHKGAITKDFVNCYNVFWAAINPGTPLQDCILIKSPEHGVWWGIGEVTGGGYPLESIKEKVSSLYITGKLGKYQIGRILRRVFLSSLGGLLMLPDHLQASVSVSPEELCIAVNSSHQIDKSIPLTLNYTVCSSPNVSSTLSYLHYLARGSFYPTHVDKRSMEKNKERILQRIEQPIWVPYMHPNEPKLTQQGVIEYVDKILASNQSVWGHILLPLSWQRKAGELTFDSTRFPNPKNLTENLNRKGFRLALTISPLVSTDTKAFRNGTTEQLWVQQKGSTLPSLIQYKSVVAGVLTDFTNPRAVKWFTSKVDLIKEMYGIDRFHLDPPDSHSIPVYHEFNQHISNPDLTLQPFMKAISSVSTPISTESILSPPPLPTFVTVGTEDLGWESLASLIPRILTLSMLGFPLIDAGVVGGNPVRAGNVPDDKLYIRWFQAASFLPAFQINVLPELYDEKTQFIIADFIQKRKDMVLPRFKKSLEGTLMNNTPLIYPLGLLYPDDVDAAAVGDEWIIGSDLLVSPILEKDKTSRDIYIPDGLWESQLDGRLKKGPGWIYNYKVPLTDLAYFIKRYTL